MAYDDDAEAMIVAAQEAGLTRNEAEEAYEMFGSDLEAHLEADDE